MSVLGFITIGILITLNSVDFNLGYIRILLTTIGITTQYNGMSVTYYQETFPNIVITLTILIISPLVFNWADILWKWLQRFYDQ